jgi:hypothetical protein
MQVSARWDGTPIERMTCKAAAESGTVEDACRKRQHVGSRAIASNAQASIELAITILMLRHMSNMTGCT